MLMIWVLLVLTLIANSTSTAIPQSRLLLTICLVTRLSTHLWHVCVESLHPYPAMFLSNALCLTLECTSSASNHREEDEDEWQQLPQDFAQHDNDNFTAAAQQPAAHQPAAAASNGHTGSNGLGGGLRPRGHAHNSSTASINRLAGIEEEAGQGSGFNQLTGVEEEALQAVMTGSAAGAEDEAVQAALGGMLANGRDASDVAAPQVAGGAGAETGQ